EGETAPLFGIDSTIPEYLRMHHAASEDFHPSRLGAGAAAGAFAAEARHIDFRGRLGEWKEARTKSHLRFGTEEPSDKVLECGAQMSDVNSFVDEQRFGLMEHRRAPHRDLIATIDAARGEHFDRRLE